MRRRTLVEDERSERDQARAGKAERIVDLGRCGDLPPGVGRGGQGRRVGARRCVRSALVAAHDADAHDAVTPAQPREGLVGRGVREQVVDVLDLAGLDHQPGQAERRCHASSLDSRGDRRRRRAASSEPSRQTRSRDRTAVPLAQMGRRRPLGQRRDLPRQRSLGRLARAARRVAQHAPGSRVRRRARQRHAGAAERRFRLHAQRRPAPDARVHRHRLGCAMGCRPSDRDRHGPRRRPARAAPNRTSTARACCAARATSISRTATSGMSTASPTTTRPTWSRGSSPSPSSSKRRVRAGRAPFDDATAAALARPAGRAAAGRAARGGDVSRAPGRRRSRGLDGRRPRRTRRRRDGRPRRRPLPAGRRGLDSKPWHPTPPTMSRTAPTCARSRRV